MRAQADDRRGIVHGMIRAIGLWTAVSVAAMALTPQVAATQGSVIVLVRHAEKASSGGDPELAPEGRRRAEALARMLRDMDLDAVYTTDFLRTRETARPVAESQGLPLTLYDPEKLDELAEELLAGGRRVLVVGHGNTTPELLRALGGDPGGPIREDEYDRLYLFAGGSEPATALIRFAP